MKLFDKISDEEAEEVEISSATPVEEEGEKETRLGSEVESKLTSSRSSGPDGSGTVEEDSGSESSVGGSMLPGMSSSASGSSSGTDRSGESSGVDLDEVHDQNKKIIGLLEDIKSEIKDGGRENSAGGGTDGLL